MKKLITIILISFNCITYGQDRKDIPVSVVTENKDTLFLINDDVGYMIQEVWDENYENGYYGDERPIIIIKPENWIIAEYFRRQEITIAKQR